MPATTIARPKSRPKPNPAAVSATAATKSPARRSTPTAIPSATAGTRSAKSAATAYCAANTRTNAHDRDHYSNGGGFTNVVAGVPTTLFNMN